MGHIARNCYKNPQRTQTKVAVLLTSDFPSDQFKSTDFQPNTQPQMMSTSQPQSSGDCEKCGHHPNSTPPLATQVHIACMNIPDCCSRGGFVTLKCGHNLPIMSAACKPDFLRGVPIVYGNVGSKSVSVLRDTGCSGVLIWRSLVSDNQMTGESKYCVFVDKHCQQVTSCSGQDWLAIFHWVSRCSMYV